MALLDIVGVGIRKVFGSRNERLLKRYQKAVVLTNALEDELRGDYDGRFAEAVAKLPEAWSDENVPPGQGQGPSDQGDGGVDRKAAVQRIRVELSQDLRDRTAKLRERLKKGEVVESVLPEAFAVLREASRRAQNHRHFDCQLIGGQVLFEGKIAEMKTGEGKTIVCHLAAYLKCLQDKKVHIVTVNDYLVKRDADFARPILELVGMTVGYIQSMVDPGGREGIRRQAYACNLTYGTNSEFGFDYLRDNMKTSVEDQVQGRLDFAVVDEVDSILIDEARTPLIISGPAEDDVSRYRTADTVARALISRQSTANSETMQRIKGWGDHPPEAYAMLPKFQDAMRKFKSDPNWINEEEAEAIGHKQYYLVTRERKQAALTHDGVSVAQEQLGMGSLYVGANMEWPHLIENALRAHVVYEKDVDYAVLNGEIIIVDQFTGRLMYGRQWSDGLHQSVEAKEGVKVKEETQTLATITLQNFFKLYKHISGMTGTAMTEADEFMKIYNLEVVAIPTNRPVNRMDAHDRIYKSVDDKYGAIVEEIHDIHTKGRPNDPFVLEPVLKSLRPILVKQGRSSEAIDKAMAEFDGGRGTGELMAQAYDDAMGDLAQGRPVLVGTISIENSEKLSNSLTRKYGIQHEVLNAKQHAREAEIVAKAGEQHALTRGSDRSPRGNVTIATNMAGRGTDIKLQKGVVYPKCIGDLGPPENGNGRYYVWREKGVIGTKCCIYCPDYDPATQCAHCWKPKADPRFPEMGRKVCPLLAPCGLHIVGTERHESRRIDNQLRGRSGRQGDPGSSRFFLSLGDDLLKLFMGEWTLRMLERMGFQDGMAIEARSITKGIERAQKKVEEKNFGIRKHLLEYDEVMDHQRKVFYSRRQEILEAAMPGKSGRLVETIWRMIDDTIATASAKFLHPAYGRQCVCDWAASEFGCGMEPKSVDAHDVPSTEQLVRNDAKEEVLNEIAKTMGEYMDPEVDAQEWDIRGLVRWAETRFGCSLSQNQLRAMSPEEIRQQLIEAADRKIDNYDLAPIEKFLDPLYGKMSLINWTRQKFGVELQPDDYIDLPEQEIARRLHQTVRAAYREREVRYPVEVALERTILREGPNNAYAAADLAQWVNLKFDQGWSVDNIRNRTIKELADQLVELNREHVSNNKLAAEIDKAIALKGPAHGPGDKARLAEWGKKRFGPAFDQATFDQVEDPREALLTIGRDLLRRELTVLERFVLLEIYDQAWKDHMHAIDLLKEAIGLRGYAEQDPKIAYKREGFQMFQEMMEHIQEKVTGIIFKARLLDESILQSRYRIAAAQHADATNQGFTGGQVQRDRDAAMEAQGERKIETIRREKARVGRNQPCPCGSGKKYKQCCGKVK
jgi:preprotein translocase subunit SecA